MVKFYINYWVMNTIEAIFWGFGCMRMDITLYANEGKYIGYYYIYIHVDMMPDKNEIFY